MMAILLTVTCIVEAYGASVHLWIPASSGTLHGDMVKGRTHAGGSLGGEVVFPASDVKNTDNQSQSDCAAYRIDIPTTDNYTLWARMFYPGDNTIQNRPNSFFVSLDTDLPKVLGNSEAVHGRWRWEGSRELPLPLGLLSQGEHVLRIWRREALESQKASPRLDVLCITNDSAYRPTDADVQLAAGPFEVAADRLAQVLGERARNERPRIDIWVSASDGKCQGKMALREAQGALTARVLYPNVDLHNVDDRNRDHMATFEIDVPKAGPYFLWGRLAYPGSIGNNPNSFFVAIDNTAAQVLGNTERQGLTWRWEGQESLQAIPLGNLTEGRHQLKVWLREAMISQQSVPYLDMLLVTNDSDYVPLDDDAPQNASSSPATDNVSKPVMSVIAESWMGEEGGDNLRVQIWPEGILRRPVRVFYTISGSARNGVDYRAIPQSALVSIGAPTTIDVEIEDDSELEGTETMVLTLVPGADYDILPTGQNAVAEILDDEAAEAQFDRWAIRSDESNTPAKLKVVLDKVLSQDAVIDYSVQNVLAEPGDDYTISPGPLVIPAGQQVGYITLNIHDDDIPEDEETIIVRLSNRFGVNLGRDERLTYMIANDDGPVPYSPIHDRILGCITAFNSACAMGAPVEGFGWRNADGHYGRQQIADSYGWYDLPPQGTEDGAERMRAMCNAVAYKQDRFTAEDLLKVWMLDWEIPDMEKLSMGHDRILWRFVRWGTPVKDLPNTKFGPCTGLCPNRHYTARVFQTIPCINAGCPEDAIADMKDIGRIYYEFDDTDMAFDFGAVYNAAVSLAMLPGATVDSVIEQALQYGSPACQAELRHALSIVEKYTDPKSREMREELCDMYANPSSPYYTHSKMMAYHLACICENVGVALCFFKKSNGDPKLAVEIACNYGRDGDCNAASTGSLAGAFAGFKAIPPIWTETLDRALIEDSPYCNNHMTARANADAVYRALQNKLRRYKAEIKEMMELSGGSLSSEMQKREEYVSLMESLGVL
jgi:hypothetical protein